MVGRPRNPSNYENAHMSVAECRDRVIEDIAEKATREKFKYLNWDGSESIVLECFRIDLDNKPGNVVKKGDQFQYDHNRTKYTLQRLLVGVALGERTAEQSAAHFCHHDWCVNWQHIGVVSLALNKAQNGCPGFSHCHHEWRCFRAGPYAYGSTPSDALNGARDVGFEVHGEVIADDDQRSFVSVEDEELSDLWDLPLGEEIEDD